MTAQTRRREAADDAPRPLLPPAGRSRDRDADRALARWLWRDHVRQRTGLLVLCFVLMAIDGGLMGALSLMFLPMFDQALIAGRSEMIYWVAAGVSGIFVVRALSSLMHRTLAMQLSEKSIAGVQQQLLGHVMRLDQGFFHRHPPGGLIERVRGDAQTLEALFLKILPGFGRDAVAVVALLGAALWIDWRWTLMVLIGAPLLVLPILALQRLIRRMGLRARGESATATTRLDEVFHGIYTIQRNGLESREASRFEQALSGFRRARVRTVFGEASIGALSDVVAALGFALVLIYAGAQIAGGERTVGEFMAFFTACVLLFEPIRRLSSLSGAWQTVLASLERLHGLLQIAPTVTQPAPPLAPLPRPDQTTIRFEQVHFAYEREPVLNGFDLVAQAGQTTALVGPSGAGKSTVFSLLTRLADPREGRITIDGHDIRQMDLPGLRRLFSVVAQDSALFDETLRENIVMGAGQVDEARLRAAVEAAHVDEFLPLLPDGLESRVGPRGSALSGGQRQRVAIARALLRDAPILLLDEATSALDARSESLVQAALDRLSAGRTTLVIAHRLSTVRRADRIVVMDQGRVVEQGTHDDLIARAGAYAQLHDLQFRNGDAPGGTREAPLPPTTPA